MCLVGLKEPLTLSVSLSLSLQSGAIIYSCTCLYQIKLPHDLKQKARQDDGDTQAFFSNITYRILAKKLLIDGRKVVVVLNVRTVYIINLYIKINEKLYLSLLRTFYKCFFNI